MVVFCDGDKDWSQVAISECRQYRVRPAPFGLRAFGIDPERSHRRSVSDGTPKIPTSLRMLRSPGRVIFEKKQTWIKSLYDVALPSLMQEFLPWKNNFFSGSLLLKVFQSFSLNSVLRWCSEQTKQAWELALSSLFFFYLLIVVLNTRFIKRNIETLLTHWALRAFWMCKYTYIIDWKIRPYDALRWNINSRKYFSFF